MKRNINILYGETKLTGMCSGIFSSCSIHVSWHERSIIIYSLKQTAVGDKLRVGLLGGV